MFGRPFTFKLLLGLTVLGFFTVSCSKENVPEKESKQTGLFSRIARKPVRVTEMPVTMREVPLVITASGNTEASNRHEVKAPAAIKVEKVFVEEGARVQAGDALIKFNDELEKLKQAKVRAEAKEAEAGLANANYLQKNREQLISEGKMSAVEAEGLDEKINLYQATMNRADAEIKLDDAMSELILLNSPIPGVVVRKSVNDAADVAEGQSLIEVAQLDPIYFVFQVEIDSAVAIEKGSEISVKFAAVPGKTFSGEIINFNPSASTQESKGVGATLKIKIANPDLSLKEGMRGQVVIHTQSKKKVALVAETALARSERSVYVYKIEGGDAPKVKKMPVELGEPIAGQPTVDKGLAEGDRIVAFVTDGLQDGVPVEIQSH